MVARNVHYSPGTYTRLSYGQYNQVPLLRYTRRWKNDTAFLTVKSHPPQFCHYYSHTRRQRDYLHQSSYLFLYELKRKGFFLALLGCGSYHLLSCLPRFRSHPICTYFSTVLFTLWDARNNTSHPNMKTNVDMWPSWEVRNSSSSDTCILLRSHWLLFASSRPFSHHRGKFIIMHYTWIIHYTATNLPLVLCLAHIPSIPHTSSQNKVHTVILSSRRISTIDILAIRNKSYVSKYLHHLSILYRALPRILYAKLGGYQIHPSPQYQSHLITYHLHIRPIPQYDAHNTWSSTYFLHVWRMSTNTDGVFTRRQSDTLICRTQTPWSSSF